MHNRIYKLREQSLNAVNKISAERALLITEFYKNEASQEDSIPVQRAKAFYYILANKHICINEGELIVGERGPAPKATPTYPEICLHSIKDLDILDSREKVSFKVDKETKEAYENIIIPFWTGKTNRERIFKELPEEWQDAYKAGIFTEFQEQRAPGHTVLGKKMFTHGMDDLKEEISISLSTFKDRLAEIENESKCDADNVLNISKEKEEIKGNIQELIAMNIACDAIVMYARRHAEVLSQMAKQEEDEKRREELIRMSAICQKVPAKAPETIHEVLQHYWFIHLGVVTELNPWDSFNPGRLDQHLQPLYEKELNENKIDKDGIYELLQAFWVKFNNHPSPPKVGVTAQESNTYTDFALINVGGVDEQGRDAVNEMTYIILDVIKEMRLLQPSSMIQVSKKNPDNFISKAMEIVKTGFGQPSIFNTDALIQEMLIQGKDIVDARNGGCSGCVETGAFGTEAYILTGYFNLPKILELTLNNGFDKRTGKQLGPETGNVEDFKNFDDFLKAYKCQLEHFANIKLNGNNIIEKVFMKNMPVPFLSAIIEDCIKNGKDYICGGARYNSSYVQGVGLGSITDMITAIKYHVYDKKNISFPYLMETLESNFSNDIKLLNQLIYHTPKYGNDNDYADDNAVEVFNMFYDAINGRKTPRGAVSRINMLPTTCHVYFGSVIGATPDGRLAKQPLSEGISPFQGTDINGPTAVIKSASKIDHLRTGGTLLNQKFSPHILDCDEGVKKLVALVRSYFRLDGHHIQFNIVSAKTLKDAQLHPELYKDLIVRVAGYSDYFNHLGEDLQNEIIRRTEQDSF